MARLVMVNNGSERETERILDEFAEALDDRAILVATSRNVGTVAAINLGIARTSAPFVLISSISTRLDQDWFAPVLSFFEEHPAAGVVALDQNGKGIMETDHGSLDAMVVRRELLQSATGLDDSLDGALWALRDFTRRALRTGYLTFGAFCPQLRKEKYPEFGSHARRVETIRIAGEQYTARWGAPCSYLLLCADVLPDAGESSWKDILLDAARQGHSLTVVAGYRLGKSLERDRFALLHRNIALHTLPRLFSGSALRRIADSVKQSNPDTLLIADALADSVPLQRISVAAFTACISSAKEKLFRG
jgi:hypothetical protein